MGSFLDKPQTQKETARLAGVNGLRVGISAMQGWRVSMEDAHCVRLGIEGCPDYNFLAVFDGHGGHFVSSFSAKNLLRFITDTPEWKRDHRTPKGISEAFKRGFLNLDTQLRQQPVVVSGEDHSGSTAIASFVTPTHLIVANCGDSRCVLIRGGQVVEMSRDHKPYNEEEKRRIERAGGMVAMRRVNGDLAVSRALGDFLYKHKRDMADEDQQVSALPEVIEVERTDADQFLVLACDGIWDVMSNQDVANFILDKVTREGVADLGVLSEMLLDACLALDSRDNMSCVIVAFKGAPAPSTDVEMAAPAGVAVGSASRGGPTEGSESTNPSHAAAPAPEEPAAPAIDTGVKATAVAAASAPEAVGQGNGQRGALAVAADAGGAAASQGLNA